jgi:hypothetical protein
MSRSLILSFSLICAGIVPRALAQAPHMTAVDPGKGKVGSVLRVTGVNLDKQRVDEVYLSDKSFDMMVKVLDQTADYIKFRIPPSIKPGRMQVVIKTAGKDAILLEQPVFVTIEAEKDSNEVAAARH